MSTICWLTLLQRSSCASNMHFRDGERSMASISAIVAVYTYHENEVDQPEVRTVSVPRHSNDIRQETNEI